MKNVIPRMYFLLVGPLLCSYGVFAAETNSPPEPVVTGPAVEAQPASSSADATLTSPATAPAPAATPKLPYGVDDVLKLSQAQIHDDVILNYIQSVGTVYNLGPKEIVYLRNEGVSDAVINSMIDQRKKALETPAAPAPVAAPAPEVVETPVYYPEPSPVVVPVPEVVTYYPDPYVTEMPVCAPVYVALDDPFASTLYVIPDASVRAAYHGGGVGVYYNRCYGQYRSSVITIGSRHGWSRSYYRIHRR